jgi:hypothetical protein
VGSIPIARSLRSGDSLIAEIAAVAQLVEYVLGKDGVKGSSPFSSFSARVVGCFVVCAGASR